MPIISTLIRNSRYAIVPAVAYCIPVLFYLKDDTYQMTWLLYLGNALFLACMFVMAVIYSGKKNATDAIEYNGWFISASAVLLTCILIGLLLLVYAPHMHQVAISADPKSKVPPSIGPKATSGMIFILFANGVIGNFLAGTFATIISRGSMQKK